MRRGLKPLPAILAAVQILDAIGNAIAPRRRVDAHLDHLRVPGSIRPLLAPIKVASSAGLLLGLRMPRLGAVTASALVAFYSAAAQFHLGAGDRPIDAAPAALLAAGAATACLGVYLPAARTGQ